MILVPYAESNGDLEDVLHIAHTLFRCLIITLLLLTMHALYHNMRHQDGP